MSTPTRLFRTPLTCSWSRVALAVAWALVGGAATAQAQEAVRPSITRRSTQQPYVQQPAIYNLKVGPVSFRASASLRAEFVDNVNLGDGDRIPRRSDIILTPTIGVGAFWSISELNTLSIQTTFGYQKYLNNPELDSSTLTFSPDSAVRLIVYAGDFRFTLRDQFSFTQDPVGEGAVGNVARFGRFTNTAGLDALWDLNNLIVTASYDHTDFVVTDVSSVGGDSLSNFNSLDHVVDQISGAALLKINAMISAGVEATTAYVRFPAFTRANYTRASLGPFVEAQLTRYTRLSASGGYQRLFSDNEGSDSGDDSDRGAGSPVADSFYANAALTNQLNQYTLLQLAAGHENEVGLFSQRSDVTFVSLNGRYQLFAQTALNLSFRFEDRDESGIIILTDGNNVSRHFQQLSVGLSMDYQFNRHLSATVGYQYNQRFSDSSGDSDSFNTLDYYQNRIILSIGYQF